MLNSKDKKYKEFKVSPGAQLYIADLEQQIKKLEKKVVLYENTREMPAYIRDQEQQINELKDTTYFKHLQKEIEEAQMSVEQQKRQIKELENLLFLMYDFVYDDSCSSEWSGKTTIEVEERIKQALKK